MNKTLITCLLSMFTMLLNAQQVEFFEDAHGDVVGIGQHGSAARNGDDAHGGRAGLFEDARAFFHRRAGGEDVVHEDEMTA